jgi:hypothetical protein
MTGISESRDGSVDIATGYGQDGWGSIPCWGKNFLFSKASTPALGPIQPPSYPKGTEGSFPGGKAAG